MPRTDALGKSQASFKATSTTAKGKAIVHVTIDTGALRQSLRATFMYSPVQPRHAPVASPTASATSESAASLSVSARALPPSAVSPAPVYIVVYARNHSGDQVGAAVSVQVAFKEGIETLTGVTDAFGVATMQVDTGRARTRESVKVSASVSWNGAVRHISTGFDVLPAGGGASQVATSTPFSTPTPTASPYPASTAPTATAEASVFPTPTDYPTATPFPTPTMYPTSTASPVAPVDTLTATDTPATPPVTITANTPVPTATLVPTATPTPLPTSTSTPMPQCPGSQSGCMQAMLNILNTTRRSAGLSPLSLNPIQSAGTAACAGSYGHSQAMAASGQIWHQNAAYPSASFPTNLCVSATSAGENVGQFGSGNELTDLQQMQNLMMSEPHDVTTCANQINHACNIINNSFTAVGIGIYFDGSRTWLTEDFLQ